MTRSLKMLVGSLAVAGIVAYYAPHNFLWLSQTALAVGDLTIDWGVTPGDPIFTITNFAPGQTATEQVMVNNGSSQNRPVGVRGEATDNNDNLSDVLEIVISSNDTLHYGTGSPTGPKTLTQFFAESVSPAGIPLLTLAPGQTRTIDFVVTFMPSADNDFQQASVTFDITLGIAIELPASCEAINFTGATIFGTSRSDSLRGTAGNDLIVGFEGSDNIRGEGGHDCIMGGPGNDNLRGDGGNDIIFGEGGNDSIRGDAGDDYLNGGDGRDTMRGDAGHDTIEGGLGNDTMRGDGGNDTIHGNDGTDTATGDGGTDTCTAERQRGCEV